MAVNWEQALGSIGMMLSAMENPQQALLMGQGMADRNTMVAARKRREEEQAAKAQQQQFTNKMAQDNLALNRAKFMAANNAPSALGTFLGAGAMPGAGMGSMPGAGMGAMPGAGMGAMPGAGMGAMPGAGMGAMPGAGMGATAQSPVRAQIVRRLERLPAWQSATKLQQLTAVSLLEAGKVKDGLNALAPPISRDIHINTKSPPTRLEQLTAGLPPPSSGSAYSIDPATNELRTHMVDMPDGTRVSMPLALSTKQKSLSPQDREDVAIYKTARDAAYRAIDIFNGDDGEDPLGTFGLAAGKTWAGSLLAPRGREFTQKAHIVQEFFLRAATGAAAPENEHVRFGTMYIPGALDTPQMRQEKLGALKMFFEHYDTAGFDEDTPAEDVWDLVKQVETDRRAEGLPAITVDVPDIPKGYNVRGVVDDGRTLEVVNAEGNVREIPLQGAKLGSDSQARASTEQPPAAATTAAAAAGYSTYVRPGANGSFVFKNAAGETTTMRLQ